MRVYYGRIFRLRDHIERLRASASYLSIAIPMSWDALAARLQDAVTRSAIQEAIVRVALIPSAMWDQGSGQRNNAWAGGSRPKKHDGAEGLRLEAREQDVRLPPSTLHPSPLTLQPSRTATPSIVVQPVQLPAPELYRRGIRVAIVPARKYPVSQIDPQTKYSARLGSVMAVMDAQLRGVDEAVFLDPIGSVTESTASNLGIIKRGQFLVPPCWLGLLAGITWNVLVEAARQLRLPVRETPLTRHELYNANEAFLTSSIKEIIAVTAIDGRAIGGGRPGPVTKRLHAAFREIVRRELGPARGAERPAG